MAAESRGGRARRKISSKVANRVLRTAGWTLDVGFPRYQGEVRDTEERWELIKAELKRQEPRNILDIGCAEGWFLRHATQELDCYGIGVDKTRHRLLKGEIRRLLDTRQRYAAIQTTLDPEVIRRLPRVDVALCLSVLHHIINQNDLATGREFLAALASVTEKAIIFEMGTPQVWRTTKKKPLSAEEQAPRNRELLESAGLREVRELGRTPGYKGIADRSIFVASTG